MKKYITCASIAGVLLSMLSSWYLASNNIPLIAVLVYAVCIGVITHIAVLLTMIAIEVDKDEIEIDEKGLPITTVKVAMPAVKSPPAEEVIDETEI